MYEICYIFLVFFIYSVLGYISEVIGCYIETKKVNFSRGFLIGPYLPIFGFGSLIISFYLYKYNDDLVALYVMGSFFCCLLEYFTSLILEKIFKLRWWDYSKKKYNLNGRICLETGLFFGVASIIIVKFSNPIIFGLIDKFNRNILIIVSAILFIIFLIDVIISTYTICKLEIDTSKFTNKDSTKQVREEVIKSLKKYRFFHRRLFKAFPEASKRDYKLSSIRQYLEKKRDIKKN